MKPWFEKEKQEADIIKFPEPERKVIKMPSVSEYPDFITGVLDLQARRDQGQIGQDSYDKLYQDLIHRFMKKESFETPWFLRENVISTASNERSAQRYLGNVNKLLKQAKPMRYGKDGSKTFVPNPGQAVQDMKSLLLGKLDGKDVKIKAGQIWKGGDVDAGKLTKSGKEAKQWNAGGVSEGLFGIGLFIGFLANRNINRNDIANAIQKYLKVNGQQVGPIENKLSKDKFSLLIKLAPKDWNGLTNPKSLDHPSISGHVDSIAQYINVSQDFQKIKDDFIKDKIIDNVKVIADGISSQKATTVDVYVTYADGKKLKFERSIKSGKVKQFGQGPSPVLGRVEKDDATYSREHRWMYQENFWEDLGCDISDAEDIFLGYKEEISDKLADKGQKNLTAKEKELAEQIDRDLMFISYKAAVDNFNEQLKNDKGERIVILNLFDALKQYAGAKMVHIYSGGYRVMDFNKLDDVVQDLDLKAFLLGEGKMYPKVIIGTDTKPENVLVSITVKTDDRKASNQVDMGYLLKEITKLESK